MTQASLKWGTERARGCLLLLITLWAAGCAVPPEQEPPDEDVGPGDALLPDPDWDTEITGDTYFLNAETGDDARDGRTRETAWKTLSHALTRLQGGDGLLLASGNHGALIERTPPARSGWVTLKADEGATPILTHVSIRYDAPAPAWLRLEGLRIEPEWVDPGADPQTPNATSSTWTSSALPVRIANASKVRLLRSSITGTNKYLTPAALELEQVEDVQIYGVHARRMNRGIFIADSRDVWVAHSRVHEGVSSCIRLQPGNENVVVDAVHCHDFNWDVADDYCPRGDGNTPHGSAVAIRSSNVTVRNSMFHDGWGSSGLMLYDGDHGQVASYSDVLIENNVVYDINNTYPLRLYGVGRRVTIRNNLLVGRYRLRDDGAPTPDGRYRYESALSVHGFSDVGAPSELHLHNNILVGMVSAPLDIDARNNLVWSWRSGGEFHCGAGETNTIATCSYGSAPPLFEEGFFLHPVDFSPRHDQLLDFTPAPGGPAHNAGDPTLQPSHPQGAMGPAGFILPPEIERGPDVHSAGPYEPSHG